jgi:hypothetical protein
MSTVPVSKVCPRCGGKDYTLRKPRHLVAFAADRVCQGCLTRYSPPTPPWAGAVLFPSVVVLFVLGALLIAFLFGPCSIIGLACQAAFCVFMLRVLIGAIRLVIAATREANDEQRSQV